MSKIPQRRTNPADAEDRFWAKVDKTDTCWIWTGCIHKTGYGLFGADRRVFYAHRYSYELQFGPVPAGLQVDHVCHNQDEECLGGSSCRHRRCVNPVHLEAVTHRENGRRGKSVWGVNSRKTHCPRGHPYDEANTYINPAGARTCRQCSSAREAKRARSSGLSTAARTHCPQGHPYSEENTYRTPEGHRKCRTCMRAARRRQNAEKRALASKTPQASARP